MLASAAAAWKIVRDLGPAWALQRAKFAAQAHLGILERRLPISDWDFASCHWLTPETPADPEHFKLRLIDRRASFFWCGRPSSVLEPDELRSQAERILLGAWPLFSRFSKQVEFPPDWHFNALDGTLVEEHAHWSHIDLSSIHDVKFVWELNRFSVGYALARAYGIARDERYAQAFWTLVEDWSAKNRPNAGVNWASGQEAALRVMAWCFALYTFLDSPSSAPLRVFQLARLIEMHGERIAGFIEYAVSQNNNHGLSEAAGLFTIGVLFPEFSRAQGWLQTGRKLIIRQLRSQIYEDGSYIQHSFNYQRVMLDLMLWVFRLGELNDLLFPQDCYELLAKSTRFMLRFCDPDTGRTPNYGGNDGSLVLPLTSCDYTDFRPTIQAAYYLTHKKLCFEAGPWNEMTERLFGPEALSVPIKKSEDTPSAGCPRTDYLKLNSRQGYAMLRAARYRRRPAQADQLHFDLWWQGENIACDAGSYLYNAPGPWTNALACTAVHNTVVVGGRDQMTRAGRFLWLDWAKAESKSYAIEGIGEAVDASQNGYAQLGVIHRRNVLCVADFDAYVVIDDLLGNVSRRTRLHWLFSDHPFTFQQNEGVLTLQGPAGPFQCQVYSAASASLSLARAGEIIAGTSRDAGKDLAVRGWRSLYYGDKEPALSLTVEADCRLPVRFVSVLAPGAVSIQTLNGDEAILSSQEKLVELILRPFTEKSRIFEIDTRGHHQT